MGTCVVEVSLRHGGRSTLWKCAGHGLVGPSWGGVLREAGGRKVEDTRPDLPRCLLSSQSLPLDAAFVAGLLRGLRVLPRAFSPTGGSPGILK